MIFTTKYATLIRQWKQTIIEKGENNIINIY